MRYFIGNDKDAVIIFLFAQVKYFSSEIRGLGSTCTDHTNESKLS